MKTYGDWLGFISRTDGLHEDASPLERATGNRLRAWVQEMQKAGNRAKTIIDRLADLIRGLRIMCPNDRFEHVEETIAMLSAAFRPEAVARPMIVPDAGVLYQWGIRLMDEGFELKHGAAAALGYRDGLIITLLATRARRLRAMSGLRLGLEIRPSGDGWCFNLPETLIQQRVPDAIRLPDALTDHINHYVHVIRPALLNGRRTDRFWVTSTGRALSEKGFQAMILRRTKSEFGIAFGPHRFRHALTTTALLNAPDDPSLAASVLQHSRKANEKHYAHAGAIQAVNTLTVLVRAKKC